MGKLLLGLIIVAVAGYFILRSRQQSGGNTGKRGKKIASPDKAADSPRATDKPYQAVTIKTRLGACNAAIAAQDKIFLSSAAPTLPLVDCDAETCACRYVYHDDRRQEDRRSPFGENHGAQHGGSEGNRREGDDRRQ